MLNKEDFVESLNACRRAGDSVFVKAAASELSAVNAALDEWCRTYGADAAIVEHMPDGVMCKIGNVKAGSPLRSRTHRPWFLMVVGEVRFVSETEYMPASLRAYVSQFCAKIGQRITVSAAPKGGCNLKRTK